jgi:hypothetical protein
MVVKCLVKFFSSQFPSDHEANAARLFSLGAFARDNFEGLDP